MDAEEYTRNIIVNGQQVTRKPFRDWESRRQRADSVIIPEPLSINHFPFKEQKDRQVYLHLGTVYNLATVRVN